ncbi:MAG: transcriptional regulator [bacterium]|nr:transcriptional regulator [bacterium]
MNAEEFDRFVESWGSMGVLWGINRSMARIHAFILLSEKPVDLDTVATRLNISRGNASMSLKDLRNWGVIQRVNTPGDRRDYYVAEPSVLKMFFRIAKERKKREFDPALDAVRQLMEEGNTEEQPNVHKRLAHMESTMGVLDRLMDKFLENDRKLESLLDFLKTFSLKD